MRILLLSMITNYKYGNTGIDHIAFHLRRNLQDDIEIKYFHHNENIRILLNKIDFNYDIYAISVFETNYRTAVELSSVIKKYQVNAIIVFGGQFVTMNYIQILFDAPSVDYFVMGDGESPMERIVDYHRFPQINLLSDKNIVTKSDFLDKEINVEQDIDRSACYDYYISDSKENNQNKTHAIMTKSNICVGACSFCCSRKGKVVYKSTKKIIDEICYMAHTFGVRKFWFCDDDIFDIDNKENRERLDILFSQIADLKMNLLFSCFAKSVSICNPLNYETLKKMSRIGFHHVFLGIDAGNEMDRKIYNKRSTLEENLIAANIIRKLDIGLRFGLIFINPYSSLTSMRESYRYLVKLKSSNFYHFGGLRLQLLNQTRLLEKVRRDGLVNTGYSFLNTTDYSFKHPEIEPIVDFLTNDFIPRADSVKKQFNTLKRKFDITRHINPLANQYAQLIKRYETEEIHSLVTFFHFLYEENDLWYCHKHANEFIKRMENNARIYTPIINDLDAIFEETPIIMEGKNVRDKS